MPGWGGRAGGRSGRSGGGGGGASVEEEQPTERPTEQRVRPLPEGITVEGGGDLTTYSFDVGGTEVAMTIYRNVFSRHNALTVEFTVGNDVLMAGLGSREAGIAALRLARIMQYDASTRPDGFRYVTSAVHSDGKGAYRALAYERMGFSRPAEGQMGKDQFAIVRNGRLTPDATALKDAEKGISQSRIERNYQKLVAQRRN